RTKPHPKQGPARNQHLARGAAVTVNDIKGCALPGCQKCRGSGLEPNLPSDQPRACRCATRRFLKRHGATVIITAAAAAFWPALCPKCDGAFKVDGSCCDNTRQKEGP